MQHALALVDDQDAQLAFVAGLDVEGGAARVEAESGAVLALGRRQGADEVQEGDVGVGLALGLLGGGGEVVAAEAFEVAAHVAAAQQLAGGVPLVLEGLAQLVEGVAAPPGGEHEVLGQRRLGDRRRRALDEGDAVEVAEGGALGVDAPAAGTDVDHTHQAQFGRGTDAAEDRQRERTRAVRTRLTSIRPRHRCRGGRFNSGDPDGSSGAGAAARAEPAP